MFNKQQRSICAAHSETITILNHYASVTASNRHAGSEEFCKRYAKFIEPFEESDYDDGYLQGIPTAGVLVVSRLSQR